MNSHLEIPEDLLDELERFPQAKERFYKLPTSHKREYIKYINDTKKTETRIRRIGKVILILMETKK